MIKTVTLTGDEVRVDGVEGFYAYVKNLGDDVIYASDRPNITAGADRVAEIPAGAVTLISTKKGAVYLLGYGKAELSGQDYGGLDCGAQSISAGIVGGSEVSKAYVDGQDTATLEAAKEYADTEIGAVRPDVSKNTDDIASLRADMSTAQDELEKNTSAIAEINDQDTGLLSQAKSYADEKDAETLKAANSYTDALLSERADKTEMPAVSAPNLLDNWYFADPINQRGVSGSISNAGYFIDRWKLTEGSVTISSGGIILNGTIRQVLESAPDQAVKASYLTSSGVQSAEYDSAAKTVTVTASNELIIAAKLELGGKQTLAREENGKWVLNDIPDRTAELMKCQRYYVPLSTGALGRISWLSTNAVHILVPIPHHMRNESPTITAKFGVAPFPSVEPVDGFNISYSGKAVNGVLLVAISKSAHGFTDGVGYVTEPGGISVEL